MVLDFMVEITETEGIPVIRVKGEIDIYTCPKLKKDLNDLMEKGNKLMILNLDSVQYIDSTGLGVIAHAAHALSKENGKLNVICSTPQVKKIFDVSGLSKKNVMLFDEEKTAIANTK